MGDKYCCTKSNIKYEEGENTYRVGQFVDAPVSKSWNEQWDKAIEQEVMLKRKRCQERMSCILRRNPC